MSHDATNRSGLRQVTAQELAEQVSPEVIEKALAISTRAQPCPAETNPRSYRRNGSAVQCARYEGHPGDHMTECLHAWTPKTTGRRDHMADALTYATLSSVWATTHPAHPGAIREVAYPSSYQRCHACVAQRGERCRLGAHGLNRPHLGRLTWHPPPPPIPNGSPCPSCQVIERTRRGILTVCLGCGRAIEPNVETDALRDHSCQRCGHLVAACRCSPDHHYGPGAS